MTSAPIAIVMPLHPPKYDFGLNFVRSYYGCNQTLRFEFFPVFSTWEDLELFASLLANESTLPPLPNVTGSPVWNPLVVSPDKRNPVASKRIRAMRQVFSTGRYDYALGIDSESEFASPYSFGKQIADWSQQKQVLAVPLKQKCGVRMWIANTSCGMVDHRTNGHFFWWVDAPIYERQDFEAYYEKLMWRRATPYWFDHFSYLCWKIKYQGWEIRDISAPSGVDACKHGTDSSLSLAVQNRIMGHSFIWCAATARGCTGSGSTRLLRYHLDRTRRRPHYRSCVQ
jgi:hypothetical protein